MQSLQRKFGQMTTKSSADDSQVAILMKDFEDADALLTKITQSTRAWRDAWSSIATFQSRMSDEFDGIYAPIVGSDETSSPRKPVETDPAVLARTNRLRREYDELRAGLMQELNSVEERLAQPAENAKSSLLPMKKTIKKRNDMKSDFERYQSRVDGLLHKQKRSERDNANLTKAEAELANAKQFYSAADEDLRHRLPTLNSLLFSLAPFFLRAQVEIQNRMLAHCYTVLNTFCAEEGLPLPPPPMDHAVQDWELSCKPAQDEIESLGCLVHGKTMRQSTADNPENEQQPSIGSRASDTASRFSIPSIRSGKPAAPPPMAGSRACRDEHRSVSPNSSDMTPRGSVSVASSSGTSPLPTGSGYSEPSQTASTSQPPVPSPYLQPTPAPAAAQFSPAGPKIDHFQKTVNTPSGSDGPDHIAAAIATKKKRPPPPPRPVNFVTALYDFDGHQSGDLAFREGDRIKVVQRTNSTDDWWEGELGGMRGQFPANYVQ